MTNLPQRLIIYVGIFVYFLACSFSALSLIANGDGALPVSVHLTSPKGQTIPAVDVYRVSLAGSPKLLTQTLFVKEDSLIVKDDLDKRYFKAIQIKVADDRIDSLRNIAVRVGNLAFNFDGHSLPRKWRLVNKGTNSSVYESPGFVSAPHTHLPFWSAAMNWGLPYEVISNIFWNKFPVLLLIATLLLAGSISAKTKNWLESWLSNQKNRMLATAGITLIIAVYRAPYELAPIATGLDPSWMLGLNWSTVKGFQWGRDIVFTYGPYYWLLYPTLILSSSALFSSLLATLLLFCCAVGLFTNYTLLQLSRSRLRWEIGGFILIILLCIEYNILDITVASIPLLLAPRTVPIRGWKLMCVFTVLALLSLCKFSYLAVSACLLLLVCGSFIVNRQYLKALASVGLFIGALYFLWLLSGQSIANLPVFIRKGYEVAQGYSEAMATPIWNEGLSTFTNILTNVLLLSVALVLIAGIGGLFITSISRRSSIWFNLLLTAPIVFLAFKEGFVRMDPAHAQLFFSQLQLILLVYLIFYSQERSVSKREYVTMTLLVGGLLIFIDSRSPFHYRPEVAGVWNEDDRQEFLTIYKARLQQTYRMKGNFQRVLQKGGFDIIPYDISLLYAYDANWNPRPVFQSYSVYTKALDSLNALHFTQVRKPNQVIFALKSIDNRYPLYEEPAVVRALIRGYDAVKTFDKKHLLLQKDSSRGQFVLNVNNNKQQRILTSLGAQIHVPTTPEHHTYAYIAVELSPIGKLFNLFFKVQPLYVDVNVRASAQPLRFRLIRQTAQDGLLVSTFVDNLQEAANLFNGGAENNVDSIRIIGDPLFYESNVRIVFKQEAIND